MSDTPKEVKDLERMTGSKAARLGRYGENHHEEAWVVPEEGSARVEVVYGGALGYNNLLDGDNAISLAGQLTDDPAFVILKHANPCGMATHRDKDAPIRDTAVGKKEYSANARAFLRAWQGDVMSAMGSVIASTRPLDLEIAKLVNNRTIDVLFVPDVEGEAIDSLKAHDKKIGGQNPDYSRTLKVVVTDGIRPMPDFIAERSTRFGRLANRKTSRVSLADDITDLFRPAEMMHCDNSGKDLMVGVVSKKMPSVDRAGLYAFGITAAKGTKSNAIMIVREYDQGCYQVLGMGAGQPNRKDAAMLAGRKAVENLKREYFKKHGRAWMNKQDVLVEAGVPRKWESAMNRFEGEMRLGVGNAMSRYREMENDYVERELGGDHVIVTSDAFFPFADGLKEVLDTGVRNVISPGGAKRDSEVIAYADQKGASLIHTGVRYFLH